MFNIATDLLGKKISCIEKASGEVYISGVVRAVLLASPGIMYVLESEDGSLNNVCSTLYGFVIKVVKE